MKYNISLAKDISRLCASCLGYLLLFVTMLYVYQRSIPEPYWLFGIPLILTCCQLIQYYCYQPVLYVLLHGVLWIPTLLIPFSYTEYRYLFLLLLLIESLRSIHVWKENITKPYDDIPWFLFTCTFLIYTVATAYHIDWFALIIYYLGIGILLLHFVQLFITGLTKLATKSEHARSMPAKKIIIMNTFIFLFFLIVFIILAVLVQYSNIDTLFTALGQILIKVIRFLIRAFVYIVTIISVLLAKNRKLNDTQNAQQDMNDALTDLQDPSLLSQILDGIITIATVLVLIYIAYRTIVSLIHTFTKRYIQDTDVVMELSKPKEITHFSRQKNSVIKQLQEFFKNDNASKIRHGYRLKIKSYKPTIYQKSDTPTAIATRIEETYQEDISELTHIYEKARYSNEEITFDDVQKGGLL